MLSMTGAEIIQFNSSPVVLTKSKLLFFFRSSKSLNNDRPSLFDLSKDKIDLAAQ